MITCFCSLPFWREIWFIHKIPRLICAETSDYIAGEGDKCVIEANDLASSIQGLEATHELSNCFADPWFEFGNAQT